MNLKKNAKILFIGDSITDCGWRESMYQPLGNGYVYFAGNLLYASNLELELSIINRGISGNTIRDLKRRLQSDCLDLKPDLVTILIGINDVWRSYGTPDQLSDAVKPKEYEMTYRDILNSIHMLGNCSIVLIEPFMFCTDSANLMLADLRAYIQIVHNVAKEFNAALIPLQDQLDVAMTKVPPKMWSPDMVHPNTWAHAWIAQKWLEAVNKM